MTPPPVPAQGKPRSENHYCSTCLGTRPFVDRGDVLHCPLCRHRLHRCRPTGRPLSMACGQAG